MQTNYGENEIKSILQKVRIFNANIGTYQLFLIDENFNYIIKLSNGKIHINIEELQDDAKEALTPERLTVIANRFVSSNPEIKHQTANSVDKTVNSNQESQSEKKSVTEWYKALPSSQKKVVLIIGVVIFLIPFYIIMPSDQSGQDKKKWNSSSSNSTKTTTHRCGRQWDGKKYQGGTYGNYCCEQCYA
ncbi:MAG: hypothetical protein KBG47_06935, partial [Bacteroidia bacterium]|nr:hypothetical protein [Bacteroidia bacterium]